MKVFPVVIVELTGTTRVGLVGVLLAVAGPVRTYGNILSASLDTRG